MFETRLFDGPVLIDSQGRIFKSYNGQEYYIPEGTEAIQLQVIPAGLPKELFAVHEVPADANGLRFQARSIKLDGEILLTPNYKLVDLGF